MVKQVVILYEKGERVVTEELPTWDEMKAAIGCQLVEHVRVLDHIDTRREGGRTDKRFVYTSMFIDEEGMINGKLRNEAATEIYQRNIRAQFPGDPNPFRTADARLKADAEKMGFGVVNAYPPEHNPGDPAIHGTAVFFEGYTEAEVTAHFNGPEEEDL